MNRVISSLKQGARGPEVVDLQAALIVMIEHAVILVGNPTVPQIVARLQGEQAEQAFAGTTQKLVAEFQGARHLQRSGAVDEPTAAAINALLLEFGLLDDTAPAPAMVRGTVLQEDGSPLSGGLVIAFRETDGGETPLGRDATDPQGNYAIRYELPSGTVSIDLRVAVSDQQGHQLATSDIIHGAAPAQTVDLRAHGNGRPPERQRTIEGRVLMEYGGPAVQLKLRLYRRGFGDRAPQALGDAVTDSDGAYALAYAPGDLGSSLDIFAVAADGKEVRLSRTIHDTGLDGPLVVNLVAPSSLQPLEAEYTRLLKDLTPLVGDPAELAKAREDAERQDLSVLNRATGWDARLVAVAANAARLAADPKLGLPADVLYGALRAGLPSDRQELAQVNPDVVESALRKAKSSGIADLPDDRIAATKQQFGVFAQEARLAVPAPGSRSTYADLLQASGVSADARDKFAQVYLSHTGDAGELWKAAAAAQVPAADIKTLQLQGKLSFLTRNSDAMTSRLMASGVKDPAELVDRDLYEPDKWEAELRALAGGDPAKLDALIPPAFEGEKVEDRLTAYAEDMSRKIRLSYPTHVVGRIAEQDAADRFKLGPDRLPTARLLRNAAAGGFRLGQTPASTWLRDHPETLNGIEAKAVEGARQATRRLQRVYQITPSDEAMLVLMDLGLTSAHDVIALPYEEFVGRYASRFPTLQQAGETHRRAQQVCSLTYNLFTIAKKLDSETPVYGLSGGPAATEEVKQNLIKQFPTMESLFGSLDYCECEHCRSVLGPAAYFVDLLQFLDIEPPIWGNFLADWKSKHGNADYSPTWAKPYDALLERRPDLPHIPLTCENTNVALPYIDVVNEILEYFVANDRLDPAAAQDTGAATSAELLAEPQNVIAEAYARLEAARYPLALPFDRSLETVRSFCDYFETPLWQLLEAFRPGDGLDAPAQPYDRADILIESLGLSAAEYRLYTDPDPLAREQWHELYGYARPVIAKPTNAANATVAIPDADAARLAEGHPCTWFDVSAGAVHNESKPILALGAPGSGGAGLTTVTLTGVWAAAPDAGDLLLTDALAVLKSAKALSRRLGVTYKEVAAIVRSGFVNPKLSSLVTLSKLGVDIQDALFYRDNLAFYTANKDLLAAPRAALSVPDQQRFDALTKADWNRLAEVGAFEQTLEDTTARFPGSGFDAKAWLTTALGNGTFDDVLILVDPVAGCDFDATTLRYADGRPVDAIALLKINLFTRLWRKLGWSIEETDRALMAFVPAATPFDAAHLAQAPLETALLSLAQFKAIDDQVHVGKGSRLRLLALWSDLATTGEKPLYAQLFLTRSVLKSDAVFDDALGQYLSAAGLKALAEARRHEVEQHNVVAAQKIDPAAFAAKPKLSVSYDPLLEVQHLSYQGVLTDPDRAALAALSPSTALPPLLDAVQVKGREFTLIKGHLLALQGALGLTSADIGRILADAGILLDGAPLSLANVSLLYRYGLLAKGLKLSIRELIALRNLSNLDPFRLMTIPPVLPVEQSFPWGQALRFVEVAGYVKQSGVTIDELEYLLRDHVEDGVGQFRADPAATLSLIKLLADGVRAIRAEHAVPADTSSVTDEQLRLKLGLALPADVVERFLAMLNGTSEWTATKDGVAPADQLKPADFAGESAIRELSYNGNLQQQKLTFRGVLLDTEKTRLEGKLPLPKGANPHVDSPLFDGLLDDVQAQALAFFTKFLQKSAPGVEPASGFLDPADYSDLFGPAPAGQTDAQLQVRAAQLRDKLVRAFLPFLQQRLIRQLVVQTLTAQTGADAGLVESLLTDPALLGTPPAGARRPLLAAFTAAADRGVDVSFYAADDATGPVLPGAGVIRDAHTGLADAAGKPVRPAAARSAVLEGSLEVPVPGSYRFTAVLDKLGAEATLRLDQVSAPVFDGAAAAAGGEVSGLVTLKSGVLYRFALTLRKLGGGEGRLLVQGETVPRDGAAQLGLSPRSVTDGGTRALTLLAKALRLVQDLGLSEREVRYLCTHAAAFGNLDLSALPASESESTPAGAQSLFGQFLRLAGYARMKQALAGGEDDLITVFETGAIDDAYKLLATLTRRDAETVKAAARAVAAAPAFASEQPLERLWEVLQVVERIGVGVESLVGWTRVVSGAATPEQRFGIARDLKEAVKARLDPEAWQRVAQPIFDRLRRRQRDALVAYIMHRRGFARVEQLFEFFLIDPEMEPVVQTSRLRLAIGSVQVFIHRCLLNLEARVRPEAINARQWEWMKRYRVWEANRKIFLFPENWLEPEFRDDKTHLFSELEGTLLKGDVSSDLVEDAFLVYLRKLEQLGRLDIVAMHLEDQSDPALNRLHVIGRSYGEPHKYFYRRYAHQTWTAWEPVGAEIEGDHLAPVIWRDRLYLFWLTFLEKGDPDATPSDTKDPLTSSSLSAIAGALSSAVANKQVTVQLHWSEYLDGEWTTRVSGGYAATFTRTVPKTFQPASALVHVSKERYENNEERGVYIHVGGSILRSFYLAGRNSTPEDTAYQPAPPMPYSKTGTVATRYSGSEALTVTFNRTVTSEDGKTPKAVPDSPTILSQNASRNHGYTVLECDNVSQLGPPEQSLLNASDPAAVAAIIKAGLPELASLRSPIFFSDGRHTFFVEPTVDEKTVEQWEEWVPWKPPRAEIPRFMDPTKDWLKEIDITPELPRRFFDPGVPHIAKESLVNPVRDRDWLVNEATVLAFDGNLVGAAGLANLTLATPAEAVGGLARGGLVVDMQAGSSVPAGASLVASPGSGATLEAANRTGGLNVVGSAGLNHALVNNIVLMNRVGFGAGNGFTRGGLDR